MVKVLFVCLGNICRSPAAQGVFESMVEKEDLFNHIFIDSCGTSNWHCGEKADPRMRSIALKRGYRLTHLARTFEHPKDFQHFDYILTMDKSNFSDLKSYDNSEKYHHKLYPLTKFCSKIQTQIVPDPYYQGEDGFDYVLDILEDSCANLLKFIKETHSI